MDEQIALYRAVKSYFNHLVNEKGYSHKEASELLAYVVAEAKAETSLRMNFMKNSEKHM